jgi:hypothetical protein
MDKQTSKILEEALKLPTEARAARAGSLIESLDEVVDEENRGTLIEFPFCVSGNRSRSLDSLDSFAIPCQEVSR